MIMQDTLADASVAAPAGDAPETPISLESRTCDELRAIASRGVHGGDLYFAAAKELERRAHDTEVAIEAEQMTADTRQREIGWLVTILFVAVVVGAIAWLFGY